MVYYTYRYIPQNLLPALEKPPKARQVGVDDVMLDNLAKYPEALQTAYRALKECRANDHRLAHLDDATRTFGVAGIASLGSLGIGNTGATSLPLWLGGASWLAGMAVTPQIINSAVWLKTGVNLGTHYQNSNGKIRPLYQDPNYMPLQVLTEAHREKMAQHLNIHAAPMERDRLLSDKIKQITVQAFTWWMLVAGITTPLFASLFCDTLENPLKDLISDIQYTRAKRKILKPALKSKNPVELEKALNHVFNARIGSESELTTLSRWWYRLPNKLVGALKLDKLSQADLLNPSSELQFQRIVAHLEKQLRRSDVREALESCIRKEEKAVTEIFRPINQFLAHDTLKIYMPATTRQTFADQARLTEATARGTLSYFKKLLELPLDKLSGVEARAHLREKMEKPVLAYIEQLIRQQKPAMAKALIGERQFEIIKGQLRSKNFLNAFKQIGDSPKSFLLKALKSMGKRRQWVNRYPKTIGGILLAASVIYIGAFLGQDFGNKKGGHAK